MCKSLPVYSIHLTHLFALCAQFGHWLTPRPFRDNGLPNATCYNVSTKIESGILLAVINIPSDRDNSYAFDVDPVTERFINRRVLAYIDAGIPDGLQVDTNGNIYAATGDGVQVSLSYHFTVGCGTYAVSLP